MNHKSWNALRALRVIAGMTDASGYLKPEHVDDLIPRATAKSPVLTDANVMMVGLKQQSISTIRFKGSALCSPPDPDALGRLVTTVGGDRRQFVCQDFELPASIKVIGDVHRIGLSEMDDAEIPAFILDRYARVLAQDMTELLLCGYRGSRCPLLASLDGVFAQARRLACDGLNRTGVGHAMMAAIEFRDDARFYLNDQEIQDAPTELVGRPVVACAAPGADVLLTTPGNLGVAVWNRIKLTANTAHDGEKLDLCLSVSLDAGLVERDAAVVARFPDPTPETESPRSSGGSNSADSAG